MRNAGPRSSRARRRHAARPDPSDKPKPPRGWPDPDTVAEALDINALASQILAELKPEVVRDILKRMDTPARKAALEPRNVPATKVSLRAATQVLNLIRAEDKPAESTLLGSLLSPAADLFLEARFDSSQLTALRMRVVDLALPLIAHNDSVYKGLRSWHHWCDESFEDIALVAVIGLRCTNAALAGAFLAANHPEIAQRHSRLLERYPAMPFVYQSRLTTSNPLSRYLAARPDRKLPANIAGLQTMLDEDGQMRRIELEQANQERKRMVAERQRRQQQREEAFARHLAQASQTEIAAVEQLVEPPTLPTEAAFSHTFTVLPHDNAVPDVTEWAHAVTESRRLSERVAAGDPPSLAELGPIIGLRIRLDAVSKLLGDLLQQPVAANRGDIDRALTLALSNPRALKALGGRLPGAVADVTALLDEPPQPVTATSVPHIPQQPQRDKSAAATEPIDLSDLDDILHGPAGAALVALATGNGSPPPDPAVATVPAATPGIADVPVTEAPAPPGPAELEQFADAVSQLTAITIAARYPGGVLSDAYADVLAGLNPAAMAADAPNRALVLATAMPMALIDPAGGAEALLSAPVPELAECPRTLALRDTIAELCHQGVSLFDPSVHRIGLLMERFTKSGKRIRRIQQTADTWTLEYDKATTIYRHWLAPGGRLRGLVDALADNLGIETIRVLAAESRKIGAARAIDDTAAEVFGTDHARIVAGARKALVDEYDKILSIADFTEYVATALTAERLADRSSTWRFDRVIKFREQVHTAIPLVNEELERELSAKRLIHPWVFAMATRAMSIATTPQPPYGPELAPEAAARRIRVRRKESKQS